MACEWNTDVDIGIRRLLYGDNIDWAWGKLLPELQTEPLLCKVAVHRELQFSIEQYGCQQRNDFIWMPARIVILEYFSIFLRSDYFFDI